MDEIKPETIEDLSLLLMYLTSWEEKNIEGGMLNVAWKGYDFDVLNSLEDKKIIYQKRKNKTLVLSDEGSLKAQKLLADWLELKK